MVELNLNLNLQDQSSEQLINKLSHLLKEEKIISDNILFILEEIEQRHIYAELGYPSLFEMLVKKFKLSESSAYTRISSMRLIKSVPAAKAALANNQLNLSTLTQIQTFIKQEEKSRRKNFNSKLPSKMTPNEKLALIEKVKGKTQREVKRELALLNPKFAHIKQQEKILNQDETQVTIVMDQELMQKLQKVRAIISHQNPNPTYQELLHIMADKMLKQVYKIVIEKAAEEEKSEVKEKVQITKTQTSRKVRVMKSSKDLQKKRSRHIPNHIQRLVWQRDKGMCQHTKPTEMETRNLSKGKVTQICGSQYFLQIDHLKPYSQNGDHDPKNLQLVCSAHNRYRWRQAKINIFTPPFNEKYVSEVEQEPKGSFLSSRR